MDRKNTLYMLGALLAAVAISATACNGFKKAKTVQVHNEIVSSEDKDLTVKRKHTENEKLSESAENANTKANTETDESNSTGSETGITEAVATTTKTRNYGNSHRDSGSASSRHNSKQTKATTNNNNHHTTATRPANNNQNNNNKTNSNNSSNFPTQAITDQNNQNQDQNNNNNNFNIDPQTPQNPQVPDNPQIPQQPETEAPITPEYNIQVNDMQQYSIANSGVYEFSGNAKEYTIIVDAPNENVTLYFNGLGISSSNDSPVYIKSAGECNIFTANGSENVLSLSDNNTHACIYSNSVLNFSGNGELDISANEKSDAIVSSNGLSVNGGNITIDSCKTGIEAPNYLNVNNGNLIIENINSDYSIISNSINFNGGNTQVPKNTLNGNLSIKDIKFLTQY